MTRTPLRRNVLAAAVQTVLQTAVLFVVYRYLVDRLGIDQLGVWSVVLASTSIARASELGMAGAVTRYVAEARAQGDDQRVSETLQTAAISLALLVAAVLLILFPLLVRLTPWVLPDPAVPTALTLLPYAMASMWLGAVSSVWLAGLDAALRTDLRAGLVTGTTLLFMTLVVLTVPSQGLTGVAIAQVGQGCALTILGWLAVRRTLSLPLLPFHWSRRRFRETLAYGANLQVITVMMLLFEPTTKVLLARYGGTHAAGLFELAQQLVTKVRALIVESNRVVVPVLAGLAGRGDARAFYIRNVRVLFWVVTPLFAGLGVVIPWLSEFWLGRYEPQFVWMATVLTVAWYLNTLTAPTYFAYLGGGALRWLTWSHVLLGGSNVVLGLLLGPAIGWAGVVAAFGISLATGSLLPVWAYHRQLDLPWAGLFSRSDVALGAISLGAAAVALTLHATPLPGGVVTRLLFDLVAVAAIGIAALRHPSARELAALMGRAAAPPAERTR